MDDLVLSEHTLLDTSECQIVEDQVLRLRAHWTERSNGGFHSLGAASYLDAATDVGAYVVAAARSNALLRASFAVLHERVRRFCEELVDDAVAFHPRFALPGFHVYVFDGRDCSRDDAALRAHFDLQWAHLFGKERPLGTLSFTLPIAEPSGGATLELWPTRYDDVRRLGMSARSYATKHASEILRYACGRIVVHDGLMLHAVGRASIPAPSGYRVTLQGHGIKTAQGWLLYW